MSPQSVVHIYRSLEAAETAVRHLGKKAFQINQVSIVTQHKEHIVKYEKDIKGGNYLVVANGDEAQVSQARTILDGRRLLSSGRFLTHANVA